MAHTLPFFSADAVESADSDVALLHPVSMTREVRVKARIFAERFLCIVTFLH